MSKSVSSISVVPSSVSENMQGRPFVRDADRSLLSLELFLRQLRAF